MKATLRIVVLLVAVAVGLVSIYFVLGERYARKTEVNELHNRVVSLETQVEEWKTAFETREYVTPFDLDEVKHKLDVIERSVANLEADLENWKQQGGKDLQRIQETLTSLGENLKTVEETYLPRRELISMLEEFRFLSADLHPVNIDLGSLPAAKKESVTHTIPETVPDTAKEILLYIYVATGYVRGGAQEFKLSVNIDDDNEATAYLYAFANVQSTWSYNSDNVWLPMPRDRKITLQSRGDAALFGDWKSNVKIIAYR